jgi:hypothetical protein
MLYAGTSVTKLVSYAWPQTQEDGFALNGIGGKVYSGTVPYGVTLGIPAGAVEPASVKANAGADMLWHALREHGAMIRDSGGSGNTVTFMADQYVNPNDPLLQGMKQYGAQIMAQVQILGNQGPNSVNGGGTPIVPLIPNPNDLPAKAATAAKASVTTMSAETKSLVVPQTASPNNTTVYAGATTSIHDTAGNTWTINSSDQVVVNGAVDATTSGVTELAYVNGAVWQENANKLWWGKTSPDASWSPSAGSSVSPLPSPTTLSASEANVTVAQSQVSVVATSGSRLLFIKGSGDTIALSGGVNTITDSGQGNTYVLPTAGNGTDVFTNNVLANNDWLDLRPALAATTWNGAASTLSNYLHVTDSGQGVTLSVSPAGSGAGSVIASFGDATTTSLSSLLAHSLT